VCEGLQVRDWCVRVCPTRQVRAIASDLIAEEIIKLFEVRFDFERSQKLLDCPTTVSPCVALFEDAFLAHLRMQSSSCLQPEAELVHA
jgi:hypothetical protein